MSTEKKIPLMPQATAVWLISNTKLTFSQIANFCAMHELEIKGIADDTLAQNIKPIDPIIGKQLTREEITRCEMNPNEDLNIAHSIIDDIIASNKSKAKYIAKARRQDKPDAIYWLIKNYPLLVDKLITKLIGTTKNTVQAIRTKAYWNMDNLRPRDPVLLGLCSQIELNKTLIMIKVESKDLPDNEDEEDTTDYTVEIESKDSSDNEDEEDKAEYTIGIESKDSSDNEDEEDLIK